MISSFQGWVQQKNGEALFENKASTIDTDSKLAVAYRNIAEVSLVFGEHAEVSEKINALLMALDELKTMTEAVVKPQEKPKLNAEEEKKKRLALQSRRNRTAGHGPKFGGKGAGYSIG